MNAVTKDSTTIVEREDPLVLIGQDKIQNSEALVPMFVNPLANAEGDSL